MRRLPWFRRFAAVLPALLLSGATACNELLSVENPGRVTVDALGHDMFDLEAVLIQLQN